MRRKLSAVIASLLLAALAAIASATPVAAAQPPESPAEPSAPKPAVEPTSPKTAPAKPAADKLPWQKGLPSDSTPVLRPLASPLEVLTQFGISGSQLEGFFSGQPLNPGEEDVLIKILFRFPNFGMDNVQEWRKQGITWDQLAAAPAEHRAEIYQLRGRVTHVKKVPLPAEFVERYLFEHYFQVAMKLDDSPYEALVCARHVPTAWKLDATLNEPASVDALFLKTGDAMLDSPPLIFAAWRVGWHPETAVPELHIGENQIALARLGVDWGLFDGVREENGRGLGEADRDPFYQVLQALGKPEAAELLKPAPSANLDIAQVIQAPKTLHGQMFPLHGTALRVVKVAVPDADIRRRFNITHYYEIDFSIPLDKPLKMGKDPKSKDALVYGNSFPGTINVLQLPPGLPEGDNVHVGIRAEGVFFKLWTYRSSFSSEKGLLQPAPLFLAREVSVIEDQAPLAAASKYLVGLAMLLAGLVALVIYWFFKLNDRKGHLSPPSSMQEAIRHGTAQASAEKPDFSGLK